MTLKIFKKSSSVQFIIVLIISNLQHNYAAAASTTKFPNPFVSTELQQHFVAPSAIQKQHHQNVTTNSSRPYKQLVFLVMMPYREKVDNDCIMPRVLPVLELAIHHVQGLGWAHNAQVDITVITRDTNCSSIYGPTGFIELYVKQPEINGVWGLPCDYVLAPISRYAGVWHIPVFTVAGTADDFQNKASSYPTLTRLRGGQSNNLGNAVTAIIESFNWTRLSLIYQNGDINVKGNSVYFFSVVAVHNKLGKHNVSSYNQAFDANKWQKADIERMLITLSNKTRNYHAQNNPCERVVRNYCQI